MLSEEINDLAARVKYATELFIGCYELKFKYDILVQLSDNRN